MRNLVVRFGLIALVIGVSGLLPVAALGQNAGAKPTPKMTIQNPEHNFGKVKEGEQVSFTFIVRNEGSGELVIDNVSPSCGCTASDFTKTVAPGKEGKITLSVNTAGMSGEVSRYADVISNDKAQANFKLWVHLEVQKAGEK
ncbi:MAG: DUF1573 domain-containing protein [Acidobacteriota bacterium]